MNNEPAFPCPIGGDWPECDRGLTKREYFAAMAMQGMLCEAWHPEMGVDWRKSPSGIGFAATNYADDLLAELAKARAEA